MDDRATRGHRPLSHRSEDRPIDLPIQDESGTVVRYVTSEAEANALIPRDERIRRALGAIGAWKDIDFDEMMDALDKIRHESFPKCQH